MLYAFKKTVLTGAILSILSPWGLTQGQELPDNNQTMPALGDMATEHNLDLAQLLLEYDGEDYQKCMDGADRARADEIRICGSLSSDIARERCQREADQNYDNRVDVCRMVGERELQSSHGVQTSN